MINCDGPGGETDRFLPLKFEMRTKTGKEDLFEKTFGNKAVHYNSVIQKAEPENEAVIAKAELENVAVVAEAQPE